MCWIRLYSKAFQLDPILFKISRISNTLSFCWTPSSRTKKFTWFLSTAKWPSSPCKQTKRLNRRLFLMLLGLIQTNFFKLAILSKSKTIFYLWTTIGRSEFRATLRKLYLATTIIMCLKVCTKLKMVLSVLWRLRRGWQSTITMERKFAKFKYCQDWPYSQVTHSRLPSKISSTGKPNNCWWYWTISKASGHLNSPWILILQIYHKPENQPIKLKILIKTPRHQPTPTTQQKISS